MLVLAVASVVITVLFSGLGGHHCPIRSWHLPLRELAGVKVVSSLWPYTQTMSKVEGQNFETQKGGTCAR